MNGHVVRVVADKGFGFIRGEDNIEYFFHRSVVEDNGWDAVQQGTRVTFTIEKNPVKGPRAGSVSLRED